MGSLTLSSSAGTTAGTTAILVSETIGSGNSLKIKAYSTEPTLPTYEQDLTSWDNYTEGDDFATTDGYYVVVCEVDTNKKALKGGSVVADVKAE